MKRKLTTEQRNKAKMITRLNGLKYSKAVKLILRREARAHKRTIREGSVRRAKSYAILIGD